ncbi:hypothetical protein WMY93_029926 [Mugilogobius chulae]|uniref:Zinc finger CCHC domain-containing protein 2 n=1 Tax=Mugilogobius chulae TaxID=88201 RepID=A0AAW0MWC3_9GOBI
MPKMKLLLNTSEDEPHQRLPRTVCASTSSHGSGAQPLNKETVFEWFGLHLDPVRRLEFMCGLLHMCQPLELRFLGSYLEDLARKDYHVLRDFECRANSSSELGNLTDVNDPVVRSKMLVCLSLLGSDSRDCAGILFQTLSRVDPAQLYHTQSQVSVRCPGGREAPVDGSSEQSQAAVAALEQLALLFTMASLHPAFHFHQRQMLRAQLDKTQLTVEKEQRQSLLRRSTQALEVQSSVEERTALSALSPQKDAVHIERIDLRSISRRKCDREYNFKVTWSDFSSSRVTKTHSELENFLLELPKHQCNESFEKGLLQLLKQEENKSTEEQLRNCLLSAPSYFTQKRKVCCFFTSDFGPSGDSRQSGCEPASDLSSQDEESFDQGYKKKHRNKSPSLTSTADMQSHIAEQGMCGSRSHAQPTLRGKGKSRGTSNGSLAATFPWKEVVSGPDGESSSERSSCASSPQHRATDSLDSEEEQQQQQQQQQHCASWKQVPAYPGSHLDNTAEGLGADALVRLSLQNQMESIRGNNTDISPLSFMPYALPPGAPSLPKPGPGAVRMHLPPAMAGSGLMMEAEKGDHITTFGMSPIGLPPQEISAMQPLVQRFKSLSHGVGDAPTSPTPTTPMATPIRAISIMPTSLPSLPANLQPPLPCPEPAPMSSVPLVETPHTKLPALSLPYPMPPTPMTSVEAAVAAAPPVQGLLQGAVPPVVPTHTPGPAPSPSPALTPSMAHSDCTSSSPSSEACVEAPGQRSQPTLSCGVCGCQCGGRPLSASPMFFHQVGAGARPLLGMPHLFPLTNYLPQAHAAPQPQPQPNGTTLPPMYAPTAHCTRTQTYWGFSSKCQLPSASACTHSPTPAMLVYCQLLRWEAVSIRRMELCLVPTVVLVDTTLMTVTSPPLTLLNKGASV